MYSKISIALTAAVLSPLFVVNPVWAAQKSMDEPIVIAGGETERDKSYPGWEGFQPFKEKQKEGGSGQPEMGQPPQGQQGQPEMGQQPQGEGQQGQPEMEQQRQEGEQGTGRPGGETGGNTGMEGGEGGQDQ